mgnify:CR=1 FL=1
MVSEGRIRPNTPISFNYAENDAFSFTAGGFGEMAKVSAIAMQAEAIEAAIDQSGFEVPSDYFDQWLAEIYCPEHLPAILEQFGCPNGPNGEIIDCKDKMDRYLTSTTFACNTRFALNGDGIKSGWAEGTLGPVYPMEFRYRSCDPNENDENQKTCHCAEGSWILGGTNLNILDEPWKSFGLDIRTAYGEFFRTGSFPANTMKSYEELNFDAFNILDGEWNVENVRDGECDSLDPANNYNWDKWMFGDNPTATCQGGQPIPRAPRYNYARHRPWRRLY